MPVPLSDQEWAEINRSLPDISNLDIRISKWRLADYVVATSTEMTKKLRLSQVCFRDAISSLVNARYAIGQAIAVKKYFLSWTEDARINEGFSHIRGVFYANYVSLLVTSAIEHTITGIEELFSIPKNKIKEIKSLYRLGKFAQWLNLNHPNADFTHITLRFDNPTVSKIIKYRNNWVHNKPPIIQSPIYNPPREHYTNSASPIGEIIGIGISTKADFTFDEVISLFKEGIAQTLGFLTTWAEEWEHIYSEHKSDMF